MGRPGSGDEWKVLLFVCGPDTEPQLTVEVDAAVRADALDIQFRGAHSAILLSGREGFLGMESSNSVH
jgi:hypothetical protein